MAFVMWYFMHVKWSSRLIWLTAISGFFWLAIMFAFTMQDYLTRGAGVFKTKIIENLFFKKRGAKSKSFRCRVFYAC
jgi:hypothetical protein